MLQWGTVPEWVAGVGTVGAFGAAVLIYASDTRRRHEEVRASQARLADAWVARARWRDPPYLEEDSIEWRDVVDVWIRFANGSSQALRGTDVELLQGDQSLVLANCGVVPPTAPGCFEERHVELRTAVDREKLPDPFLDRMFRLVFEFTDASGNRWARYPDGKLVRTSK